MVAKECLRLTRARFLHGLSSVQLMGEDDDPFTDTVLETLKMHCKAVLNASFDRISLAFRTIFTFAQREVLQHEFDSAGASFGGTNSAGHSVAKVLR